MSISFNLREYLLNNLALRLGVGLSVGFETFDKFAFGLRISSSIGRMPAKPIAEPQLRNIRWCANVDVMRTTTTKRRHTLNEEHPVCARILGPVDVTKTRKRSDQVRPNRDITKNDKDVNNRLRGEIWNGRASEMFNARFEWPQHLRDGAGLCDELVAPRRVRINDLNRIFRGIAPLLSVMCHWHCHGSLCRLTEKAQAQPRQPGLRWNDDIQSRNHGQD